MVPLFPTPAEVLLRERVSPLYLSLLLNGISLSTTTYEADFIWNEIRDFAISPCYKEVDVVLDFGGVQRLTFPCARQLFRDELLQLNPQLKFANLHPCDARLITENIL